MRIVQFVHGHPPEFIAGTEKYTQSLSRRLVERGHTCMVVAGSDQASSRPSIAVDEDQGVQVVRLIGLSRRSGFRPVAHDPVAEEMIRWLLDLWRPELAHIQHWRRLTNTLVAVCREFDIPTVVTLHDQWIACSRVHRLQLNGTFCDGPAAPCASCVDRDPWQMRGEIERELSLRGRALELELQWSDHVLVPSQAQKQFLQQIASVPAHRLEVVPLGSPVAGKERLDPQRTGFPVTPLRVGYWGYLTAEKGVHLLLEAAQRLPKDEKIEWHLYGPPVDPVYEMRLYRLALGRPVFFHRNYVHDDLLPARLDIAVFPSLCHETYSFVLDEAFQLGLPVVVPNRGALCERVGEAGLLFNYGDAGDLAEKIEFLLQNPEALARLKRAGMVGKVVSMEDHVTRLEKIYQEVVDSHKPGPMPEREYRKLLLHQHRKVADRDREIEYLVTEQERAMRNLKEELRRALQAVIEKEALLRQAQEAIRERDARLLQAQEAIRERDARLLQAGEAIQETRRSLEVLQGDHANLRAFLLNLKQSPMFRLQGMLAKLSRRS